MSGTALTPSDGARAAYLRRLPVSRKLALAVEILRDYIRIRWWLARNDIRGALETIRGGTPAASDATADQVLTGLRLGRVVNRILGVLPADSRCLVRSLVLTSLLARRSIPSVLVIGVRSDPDFKAHAWVEHGGYPILSPGDEPYGRLIEL